MTTREKYLAKPRTGIRKVAYDIATMLGLKGNMIHQRAVREYKTSWQLTYHEVILLVAAALAITAITTLASCSADDTATTQNATPSQPIHEPIEVNIGSNLTVTRSTVENSEWTTGDKVVLVIRNNVSGAGETTTAHTYVTAASGNSVALNPVDLANTNFWQSTSETKQIVSAWSYGNSTDDPKDDLDNISKSIKSFTLPTTQNGTKELLYSPGQTQTYNATPASRAFSLILDETKEPDEDRQFFHQLSKVVFNVQADKDLTITSASMTIPTSGNLSAPVTNTTTNNWTPGADGSITPAGTVSQTAGPSTTATYSAIVIPGDYDGKTLLSLTTSDGFYTYKVPIPGPEEEDFIMYPGMCYTFTISIKNGIVFNAVSITAWENDDDQELEFK